ncbi:MAG: hypothetical protein EZS28_040412, partial [Streblomastix strix]
LHLSKQGVVLPDFATFSFQVPKIDAGNQGSFNKRIPIFKINAQFSAAHGVSGKSIVLDTDNVPPVLLNFSTVGAYCGVFREKASQCYRMFLQALGAAIHRGEGVNLDLRVGHFVVAPGSNWGVVNFRRSFQLEGPDVEKRTNPYPKYQSTRFVSNPVDEIKEEYFHNQGQQQSSDGNQPNQGQYDNANNNNNNNNNNNANNNNGQGNQNRQGNGQGNADGQGNMNIPQQIHDAQQEQEETIFWRGREIRPHTADGQPATREKGGKMGTGPLNVKVSPARYRGIGDGQVWKGCIRRGTVGVNYRNPYDMPRQ